MIRDLVVTAEDQEVVGLNLWRPLFISHLFGSKHGQKHVKSSDMALLV